MKKQLYYGILSINFEFEDMYTFFEPIFVMKGTIENDYFINELGQKHVILNKSNEVYANDTTLVTSFISESEFNKKYSGSSKNYLDDYNNYLYYRKTNNSGLFSEVTKLNADMASDYLKKKIEEELKFVELLGYDLADILSDIIYEVEDYKSADLEEFNGCVIEFNEILKLKIKEIDSFNDSILLLKKIGDTFDLCLNNFSKDRDNSIEDNHKFNYINNIMNNYSNFINLLIKVNDKDELLIFLDNFVDELLFEEIDYNVESNNKLELNKLDDVVLNNKDNYLGFIKELKDHLDEYVIGQDLAKEKAIMTIIKNSLVTNNKHKLGCLFYGSTGSGKSYITEVLCEYLKVPYVIFDITPVSAPGYVGENLESVLSLLYQKAGKNLDIAQNGVVVFEEIDKKIFNTTEDSVSGKGVLHQLLKFVEGSTYDINVNKNGHPPLYFDTSKLTFFYTGAFQPLIDKFDKKEKVVGFNTSDKVSKKSYTILELCNEVGFPKEFAGRIGNFVKLDKLTKEDFINIISNAKDNAMNEAFGLFEKLGINFEVDDSFLPEVADFVSKSGFGGRSLNTIVNDCFDYACNDILFGNSDDTSVILDANLVKKINSSADKTFVKK